MRHFLRDERGATAIEYALIAGLLVLAVAAVLPGVGQAVLARYQSVAAAFP
jgi:pilus assembly protein Flp/PilA